MAFDNFDYSGAFGGLLGSLGDSGGAQGSFEKSSIPDMPDLYYGDRKAASVLDPTRFLGQNKYRDVSEDVDVSSLMGMLQNMNYKPQQTTVLNDVRNEHMNQLMRY